MLERRTWTIAIGSAFLVPAYTAASADFIITNCPPPYQQTCGCIQRSWGVDCSNKYGRGAAPGAGSVGNALGSMLQQGLTPTEPRRNPTNPQQELNEMEQLEHAERQSAPKVGSERAD
jgi:hypothetical protein